MAADPFNKNSPGQNAGTMTEPGTSAHPQSPAAGAQTGGQSTPGSLGTGRPPSPPESLPSDYVAVSHATLTSPATNTAVGEALIIRIGSLYKLEGFIDGQPVVYVGKAWEIKARIGSRVSEHHWGSLVKDPKTKVSMKKVYGKPDVQASNRGTARSARDEALFSQEEKSVGETEQQVKEYNENLKPGQQPKRLLNDPAARTRPENVETWQQRHNASMDEKWEVIKEPGSSAITFRAFVGLQVAQLIWDAIMMTRNQKIAQYQWAPYVFLESDEESSFTLQDWGKWWGFEMHYEKRYITGPRQGTTVEISKEEFKELVDEAHALYGDVDFWGDFVPGILMPRLPVAPAPLYDPNTMA
jgi:hypothetical protein